MSYTNLSNIDLPIAVWLATDTYDHNPDPYTISATSLLNSTKSLILTSRLSEGSVDILTLLASRVGTATHDSLELAMTEHLESALQKLGHPQKVIDNILVNPPEDVDTTGKYVFRVEERHHRKLGDWTISGKYDLVEDGEVSDLKTTKVYSWIKGTNWDKYAFQGSVYRWLRPDLITKDTMKVHMLFTDWNPIEAMKKKEYPAKAIMTKKLPLLSLADTELAIKKKLDELDRYAACDEEELPPCTPEQLWQGPTIYKYFSKPGLKKAQKNFTNQAEAMAYQASKGTGFVNAVPGEVKFCRFCSASRSCQQAEQYRADGLLKDI
jgi:hypothetical protein